MFRKEELHDDEIAIIDEVKKKHGIKEFKAWVRYWIGDEVQIDGTVTVKELACITEIVQRLNENDG